MRCIFSIFSPVCHLQSLTRARLALFRFSVEVPSVTLGVLFI